MSRFPGQMTNVYRPFNPPMQGPKPAPIGGFGSPGNAPAWRPTPPPGMSEGKYPFSDFKNIWGGQEEEEERQLSPRERVAEQLKRFRRNRGGNVIKKWREGGGRGGWGGRPQPGPGGGESDGGFRGNPNIGGGWWVGRRGDSPERYKWKQGQNVLNPLGREDAPVGTIFPWPVDDYITHNQSMRGGPLGGMATMRSQASPGGMPQQMGAPMGFGGVPGGGMPPIGGGGVPSMMTSRAGGGTTRGQGGGGDLGGLFGNLGGGGFDLGGLLGNLGGGGGSLSDFISSLGGGGGGTGGGRNVFEMAPTWYRDIKGSAVGPGWRGTSPEDAVSQNQYKQYMRDAAWNEQKFGRQGFVNPNQQGMPGAIAPDWYVHSPDTQVGQVSAGWWHNPFGTGSPDAAAKTNQLLQEQRMRDWQGSNRQAPSIEQIEHARPWTTRHIPYPDQGPMNFGLGGGGPDLKGLIGGIFGKEGGGGGGRPDELFGFTGGGIPNPLGTVADQGYFGSSFGSGGLPETNIKSGPAPQWAINQAGKNILRTPGVANDPIASAAMAASGAEAANQFTRDFAQRNAQFGLTRDAAVANQGLALANYMLGRKGADLGQSASERQMILRLLSQLGLLG